ncbi:hypothetical protein D7X88_05525 [bacterium C-53]|nr:hypothetical protein [Lachnospiraceae bacterium]NBI02681.1 hypothetical protein [Lachnospiraceae bacterium]RKJ11319.1 hypothetical protein D7X88_05525 [bacterium C-53]
MKQWLLDRTGDDLKNINFIDFMDDFTSYGVDSLIETKEFGLWERILQFLKSNSAGLGDLDRVAILNCVGYLANLRGDYKSAFINYEDSIRQLAKISPDWVDYFMKLSQNKDSQPVLPQVYGGLAGKSFYDYLYLLGDVYYRKARISIRTRKPDADTAIFFAIEIFDFLYNTDDPDFLKSEQFKKIKQYRIELYNGVALLNRYKKDFPVAIRYARQSIKMRLYFDNPAKEKIYDIMIEWADFQCTTRTAAYFNTLGQIFLGIGRQENNTEEEPIRTAIRCFEISMEIKLRIDARNPALPESYNNLGKAYELLIPLVKGADAGIKKEQLFKKSKEFHDKALNFKLLAYYPNKMRLAITYKNLGGLYRIMSEYSKSLTYYEMAVGVRLELFDEDSEQVQEIRQLIEEVTKEMENTK